MLKLQVYGEKLHIVSSVRFGHRLRIMFQNLSGRGVFGKATIPMLSVYINNNYGFSVYRKRVSRNVPLGSSPRLCRAMRLNDVRLLKSNNYYKI